MLSFRAKRGILGFSHRTSEAAVRRQVDESPRKAYSSESYVIFLKNSMSYPRLVSLILPLVLGLPLLTSACGAPVAVAAVSYGADGVSLAESGKSTTDHLASMASKKDCALWRVFRNQKVCREREGDKDPYQVDYNIAERQVSEGGVAYSPPLHAASNAPPTAWTADAYKPAATPAPSQLAPEPATAAAVPVMSPSPSASKASAHRAKKKAHAHGARKASPGQVASLP